MTSGFEQRVTEAFSRLKAAPFESEVIAGTPSAGFPVELVPFGRDQLDNDDTIARLADWRRSNIAGFTKLFHVTEIGTRTWSRDQLIERHDRLLLLVRQPGCPFVGHLGLASFDFGEGTCEIDNVVRGDPCGRKGMMQAGLSVLLDWTYRVLLPQQIRLRTLNDNSRALALYHRLNFVPAELHPLKRVEGDGFVEWIASDNGDKIDRFMIAMRHARE